MTTSNRAQRPQPPTLKAIERMNWGIFAYHRGTAQELIAAGVVSAGTLATLGKARQRITASEYGDPLVVKRRGDGLYDLELSLREEDWTRVGGAAHGLAANNTAAKAIVARALAAAARIG